MSGATKEMSKRASARRRLGPPRRAAARGAVATPIADEPSTTVDVDVQILADWIAQQGDDRWWRIDGDREAMRNPRAVPAVDLVDKLRRHGGHVLIEVGDKASRTAPRSSEQLDALIGWRAAAHGIECRWRRSDGREGHAWMIVEELGFDEDDDEDLDDVLDVEGALSDDDDLFDDALDLDDEDEGDDAAG